MLSCCSTGGGVGGEERGGEEERQQQEQKQEKEAVSNSVAKTQTCTFKVHICYHSSVHHRMPVSFIH